MKNYAGVIINSESIQLDRIFTYKIPEKLKKDIVVGTWVKVPFGKGSKVIDGFVIEIYDEIENKSFRIKEIKSLGEKVELFTEDDLKLIKYMKNTYLCTYLEAIRVFLPRGILKGLAHKEKYVVSFEDKEILPKYSKEPYLSIIEMVKGNQGKYSPSELSKIFKFSLSSINTLIKNNVLSKSTQTVYRYNDRKYENYKAKVLNDEQNHVFKEVVNSEKNIFLLKGVTGSGKTEVYMKIIEHYMKQGKNAIMLVPEIALTPQMVERFKGRFGKDVAVFHSKLSDGERFDEWYRVKNGEVKIAVGARSAIFLPFKDLGVIIIDEEHENSYKSESNPKYSARDIAEFKSKICGCKVILGSATPSVETYYRTTTGDVKLLTLSKRADGAEMPPIEIVDMRDELKSGNKSMFSYSLKKAMDEALSRDEQIILFLNRRGFSSFVSCRKCGYVFKCKNCDISMTYHMGGYLSCHYCGNREPIRKTCPSCGSAYVKQFGVGTEKVERALRVEYPQVPVIRMDFDTTRTKDAYEKIYNNFKEKKANILIGTQMVAKGLDFPDVTVVGVLAADLSLNMPDYKAGERTYQLLTQVAGRAGRGKKKGKVVVQSYLPENYAIIHSKNYDYDGFYNDEINLRKIMKYPPFAKIMVLNLSSKNEEMLIKNIQNIGINLKNKLKCENNIEILGPCPCMVSKIKEMYRWQIIIKGDISSDLASFIKNFTYHELRECYNDIRISIDINPNSLI